MTLFTSPAFLAAALPALSLYLDARLHLTKDISDLVAGRRTARALGRALAQGRLSGYYFIEKHATDPEMSEKEAVWARTYSKQNTNGGDDGVKTESYTWSKLLYKSHQFAEWFTAQGVKPGDLVGFCMVNSAQFVFAWIGLWAIGAAPAMLNYHLKGEALVHCLRVSGAKLVLVDGGAGDEEVWERVREVRDGGKVDGVKLVRLQEVNGEVECMTGDRPRDELRKDVKPWGPMALFYTSGTTGMPKACALPMAAAFSQGYASELGTNPVKGADRVYVCMPCYHGTGGINVMAQLMGGNTVCLAPKFSVSNFWRDICDSRATWFVYVGETLRYLLAAPLSPLDRQHNVHSIFGNGLRPDVWRRFCDRFGIVQVYEFFNSSEGMVAFYNLSRNDFTAHAVGHHGFLNRWKYHSSYVPVAVDTETGDILRDSKTGFARRVPYDVGGEILVRIPFERPFPGYWGDPDATEKKFVRDVFKKGDCYYRGGDALRRDSHGRWFFLDRLGDTFRWKGENVSTAEVSEVLGRFPGILEANIYGVQLPGHDGKAGAAAIYIDPAVKEHFDHRSFLRHARAHLPKYAVPLFLRHLHAPSLTHNNKQDKMPLKQEGIHPDKVAPEDEVFWVERHGKGVTYIRFTRQDWEDLQIGRAKL